MRHEKERHDNVGDINTKKPEWESFECNLFDFFLFTLL